MGTCIHAMSGGTIKVSPLLTLLNANGEVIEIGSGTGETAGTLKPLGNGISPESIVI